jgi:hypothetical protein
MAGITVLTAALLGACGDDDDSSGPGPSPAPAASEQPSAAGSTVPGAKTRRDWLLVSLSTDQKKLTLRWDHHSCGKTPQVDKSEVAGKVEILTSDYLEGADCADQPKDKWEKVTLALDEPLGKKRLVGCNPSQASTDCTKDWTKR